MDAVGRKWVKPAVGPKPRSPCHGPIKRSRTAMVP